MAHTVDIDALSTEESIDLIGEIWNKLSARPDMLPVDEKVLDEIDRRRRLYEEDPSGALPWNEVRDQILAHRP